MRRIIGEFVRRNSVQTIIISYFFIFILTVALLLNAASAYFVSNSAINRYFAQYLETVYHDFEQTINTKFTQIGITAVNISVWNELYNTIMNETLSYEEKNVELYTNIDTFLNTHKWIYGIDFVSDNGEVFRYSKDGYPGYDMPDVEFIAAGDRMKISIYDGIVEDGGNHYIAIGKRLYNYYSTYDAGYFIIYINEEFMSSLYDSSMLADTTFFVTVNDVVISCADKDILGSKVYIIDSGDERNIVQNYTMDYETLATPVQITEMISSDSLHSIVGRINKRISLIIMLMLVVSFIFVVMLTRKMLRQLVDFQKSIKAFARNPADGVDFKSSNELYALEDSFSQMVNTINTLMTENAEISEKQRIAEIRTLQAQINPHFIYNALDTITCMAVIKKQKDIENVTYALATFFRIGLSGGENLITIKDELRHVKSYLHVEQLRFPDLFEVEIDVDENIMSNLIVKISLQPLVENAIKHGIRKAKRKGILRITGKEIPGNRIEFVVSNNGARIDDKKLEQINNKGYSSGFGLKNVHERLALEYGENCGPFAEKSKDGMTSFKIVIKKITPQSNEEIPNLFDAEF
ncbi:MAG: sensor histidine kinase [Clostridia bacterium]|nr:sensor histidine kinase [Clostridia bacterium]